MEFRVLGPLEVRSTNGVIPLPRRRERVLLTALLLRPGEVVSTDALVDAAWGTSPPRTVLGSLQNGISELRKALGADSILTRAPGYVLTVSGDSIDAGQFERWVRDASALEPAERSAALTAALALWRGPAHGEFADEPFARAEASRLDELRLVAVEGRIEADLELGGGAELIGEIEAHIGPHPFRERLRGYLMLALYRAGRQAEALEAYQEARHILVDNLGIEPSPALHDLQRRILRQDPTLLAEPARVDSESGLGSDAVRKTVTTLAVALDDVSGLDPEVLRTRVTRFLNAVHHVVAEHGGSLDRFLGSEAVAVFGVPRVAEDDALRAIRAAIDLRESLRLEGDAVRSGVATGEALIGIADAPIVGEVLDIASGLRNAAPAGVVLMDDNTYALTRRQVTAEPPIDVGPRGLQGRAVEVASGITALEAPASMPFVGRSRELEVLRDVLADATAAQRCRAVTVLGEAGIGKTRLVQEVVMSLTRATTLSLPIPTYRATVQTPVAAFVRAALGGTHEATLRAALSDSETGLQAAEHLAALVGSDIPDSQSDWFWAFRVLVESLSSAEPLVIVVDDAHRADDTTLDLLEYLVERVEARTLLLCTVRPDLLERRPSWRDANARILELEPLADDEARLLVDELGSTLSEHARRRAIDRANGNPLHLEQLVSAAIDDGDIEAVPVGVRAVLSSRLDGLGDETRRTLQLAALVRDPISRRLIAALSDDLTGLDSMLLELTRKRFLYPVRDGSYDDAFRFHHELLRDVAYASLPKVTRAELHQRAAGWIGTHEPTLDTLVGWHLEQAHGYLVEIEPADPRLPELANAGAGRLLAAGVNVARTGDPGALPLLRRAAQLAVDQTLHVGALLELGPWERTAGSTADAERTFRSALELAQAVDDDAAAARAAIELEWDATAVRAERPMASLVERISESLPILEQAGDDRGLMRAWQYLASAHIVDLDLTEVETAARRAAAYAERAGWSPIQSVNQLGTALAYGPRPVSEALPEALRLLDGQSDGSSGWAALARNVAVLLAMDDRGREAEELIERAGDVLREQGNRLMLSTAWIPSRLTVLQLLGDPGAALDVVERWCSDLAEIGNRSYLATALACRASLSVEAHPADAGRAVRDAAELVGRDDRLVHALIATVEARLRAAEGDATRARSFANAAGAHVAGGDTLYERARIDVYRARALELLGDADGRDSALATAMRLVSAKEAGRAAHEIATRGTGSLA